MESSPANEKGEMNENGFPDLATQLYVMTKFQELSEANIKTALLVAEVATTWHKDFEVRLRSLEDRSTQNKGATNVLVFLATLASGIIGGAIVLIGKILLK